MVNTRYSGFFLLLFISVFVLLNGCNGGSEKIPDVSGIKVSLQTYRFDEDLFSIDTNHVGEGLQKLEVKYPDFLNFYLDTIQVFGIYGNFTDTNKAIKEGLRVFITYKDFVQLEDSIKKHFPDTKKVESELEEGFRFMKYYYPGYNPPKIFYVSLGLKILPAFTIDTNILGICLDMFLGPQYPYYRSVGLPDYMAAHLRPSYIPVAAFDVIYHADHPFVQDNRTLLDMMIQRGKEQYFLHKILPNTPDSVLFGFTQMQLNWCALNEAVIYNFFIHQNLLFSKEGNNVLTYINEGPFARDLEPVTDPVKTTPGNVGSWLGYKIVCSYMAQHPGVTLKELPNKQTDPAKFLDEARYRPK